MYWLGRIHIFCTTESLLCCDAAPHFRVIHIFLGLIATRGAAAPPNFLPSTWRVEKCSSIQRITFTINLTVTKNTSMERRAFRKKIVTITSEKFDFENRHDKESNWIMLHVQLSNIKDKNKNYSTQKTHCSVLPSIQTLIEKLKTVVS